MKSVDDIEEAVKMEKIHAKINLHTASPEEQALYEKYSIERSLAAHANRQAQIEEQIAQLMSEQRSIADAISSDTTRLKKLVIRTDQTLTDLLASKLPNVQGFNCEINTHTGAVRIQFMNCREEQLRSIMSFFKAFIDEDNVDISIDSFSSFAKIPSIIVKISSAARDRLVQGLSLSQAVPQVSSTKSTMRC